MGPIAAFGLCLAIISAPTNAEPAGKTLRIGVTPVLIHDRRQPWEEWRRYLEKRLDQPVRFVSRDSYRDMLDLIENKQVDFAWVSTYPYIHVAQRNQAKLLAVPLYRGRPYYQSYLIVPSADSKSRSILDLRGKIFAYADPYSFSGWLLPRYRLRQAGQADEGFFRKTFFTHGHSGVVTAVASGLAQGGAVDGFVWDTLAQQQPELTGATRILAKSEDFAFPPLVTVAGVPDQTAKALQRLLLGMAADADGRKVLQLLGIDGFVAGDAAMYRPIATIMQAMGEM